MYKVESIELPDLALGKEWAILELITLGLSSSTEQEMFADLINSPNLDLQELVAQAKRHKILTLLAFYCLSEKFVKIIPQNILSQVEFSKILFINRHKISLYRKEAVRLITAFKQKNIRFVGTKGIALESTVYPSQGIRTMGDMDFMILPSDREIVSKTLSDLGYSMGTFNHKTGKIKPHSRELMIKYRLSPDHLPSHVLLTDSIIVPFIEVDVANSLTWTSCPFQIPVEVALENIIYQSFLGSNNVQLPIFSPQFQFIFTILHLFKEAWIEITLDMHGKDVSLSKFSDVVRIWKTYKNQLNNQEFVSILEQYSIIQPVLWVLEHLDRTLKTNIVSELGLEGRVTEEWLSSASASNRISRHWQGTMRERLFSRDRRQLFKPPTNFLNRVIKLWNH
ncbi:MAG: nucleotidyltransferase family protein [Cyanobacteria bacterium P01_F01_bin.143]